MIDQVIGFCGGIAIVAVAAAALLITADVGLRSTGFGTIKGALETVEYFMFASAFFAAPWVLRHNAHVRVDFVLQSLPRALGRVLEITADLIGLAAMGIILWFAARTGIASWSEGRRVFKTFIFPEWWLFVAVCFCLALVAIEFLRRLRRAARGETPPTEALGL
jgi:TRAP-type C4-dicarboxylate transport system permease small subunit